ncbi:hypothetical protein B566_EDAN006330 [Ephemera danica]|nr:hypothetical protein B566_EDAN006330 [Ephemera danica]
MKWESEQAVRFAQRLARERGSHRLSYKGIKGDSVFNKVDDFHITQTLCPCSFHDIFEGVVHDMTLFIKYFVKQKWFTYKRLNRRINSFKYKASDKINMPMTVKEGAKTLTLLILRHISEVVCSHEVSPSQICELQSNIEKYLILRAKLFPQNPLRSKHHYLRHYAILLSRFGPLINVFTMRCESKHLIFKIIAKQCKNFKCISKTCAFKHQLYLSYLEKSRTYFDAIEYKLSSDYNTLPDCDEEELKIIFDICWKNGIRAVPHFSESLVEKALLRTAGIPPVFVSLLNAANSQRMDTARQDVASSHSPTPSTSTSIGFEDELQNEARISKRTRNEIVRRIISDVVEKFGLGQNPGLKLWKSIANELCCKYETHFADIMDEGQQRADDDENDTETPPRKRAKISDTLCCIEYAPDLPAGEDEKSQEATRLELQAINLQPEHTWKRDEIMEKFNSTYATLRDIINNSIDSPINTLKQDWPLFFLPEILIQFFNRLTGINPVEKMRLFNAESKLENLLRFLKTHNKKDGRKSSMFYWVIKDSATEFDLNMEYMAMMQMLYMNDNNKELIVKIKEPTASDRDIEVLANSKLPSTPLIIVVGNNICRSTDYRLMIDKQIVCHTESFMEALILNFAAYYIFRIHYASKLKSTLDCVMGIVPEDGEGTKCKKKGGGSCPEKRQNVSDLIDEVDAFQRKTKEVLMKFPSYDIEIQSD